MNAAKPSDAIGVLDRVTCILEAFDEDDRGLGLSELAVRAGLPKSTVSRLVATLVQQRYLERDGKRIHLGLRLFELGQLAEQPRELRIAALPVLAELRNRTGSNAQLAIRDGDEMVCLAAMRAPGAPPLIPRTGGRVPVHTTALGRAVVEVRAPASHTTPGSAASVRSPSRSSTRRGAWSRHSRSRGGRTDSTSIAPPAPSMRRRSPSPVASGYEGATSEPGFISRGAGALRSVIVDTTRSPMRRRCESCSAGSSMSRPKIAAKVCRLATWKQA